MEKSQDVVKMGENFKKLLQKDLSKKVETKGQGRNAIKYLSWSDAWTEFATQYPNATFEVVKNKDGLPYFLDESGAMVYTRVTANELTHEMWLPVMDGANKAMRDKPYTYQVNEYENGKRTGNMVDKSVEALTMFDVNKTIMRCLVKNLALFGLGLYIYNGEDMPEIEEEPVKLISANQVLELEKLIKESKSDRERFLIAFKIQKLEDMPLSSYAIALKGLNKNLEAINASK